MPNMGTVDGGGLIKIMQASLKESKILSGISSVTKLDDTNEVTLKNVLMSATINKGRLSVKPFDAKFGSYKTTIAGSTGLDGSIDYNLKMDVPAGKLGSQFNSLISQYSTGKKDSSSIIPLNITLGRTFTDPSVSLVSSEQKEQVKEALSNAAKEEGTKAVQEAVKGTDAEKVVDQILGKPTAADSTKKDSTATKSTEQVNQAKDAIKGLLKKKK
jgi:hypothetical protein